MSKPLSPKSLHIFSIKLPPSSLTYMKQKTLLQTFIFSHIYRVARVLAKAKTLLIQRLKDVRFIDFVQIPMKMLNKRSYKQHQHKNKLFFGSFRLHYNWCSSHVTPVMQLEHTWSFPISQNQEDKRNDDHDDDLSEYLQWLEEKGSEIDKLADLFIANCHEKFRLEKQESYRRFHEMMARSI